MIAYLLFLVSNNAIETVSQGMNHNMSIIKLTRNCGGVILSFVFCVNDMHIVISDVTFLIATKLVYIYPDLIPRKSRSPCEFVVDHLWM